MIAAIQSHMNRGLEGHHAHVAECSGEPLESGFCVRPFRRLAREERGQALVEFALIAPLFLLIVFGVIQFGLGLNQWLDLQRIANEGARWGAVNAYPGCPDTSPGTPAPPCNPTLQQYLRSEPVSGTLNPTVTICFEQRTGPGSTATIGDPLTVKLNSKFNFIPVVGLGQMNLNAIATMRVERMPTRYTAGGC
jgi:Flp pilus assembly pilin Flp